MDGGKLMPGPSIQEMPATMLRSCRRGNMLFLKKDIYIGTALDLYGEFCEEEGKVFSQILRPGHIVMEAGANIGAHTVHLAKLVGPAGMVFAFEPQRVIHQLLCANVALNELFHVHTFHAAVGAAEGRIKVPLIDYAQENNFGGLSLQDIAVGEHVPVLALDSFRLPSLHLLKVDVEGMEFEVLSGAARLIAEHRPILYVENDRRENSEKLIGLIQQFGYNLWWHLPKLYNSDNYFRNPTDIYPNVVSKNLLCTPREMPGLVEGFQKVDGPTSW